jgi:uncharacterized coiled-coil DUF342 family protein
VVTDEAEAELREELRQVEAELVELRQEVDDLRREIGDRSSGPGDRVDMTTLITTFEMQEAVLDTLEARRADLKRRLGGLS